MRIKKKNRTVAEKRDKIRPVQLRLKKQDTKLKNRTILFLNRMYGHAT